MFGFLKEKLKSFFHRSKDEIEKKKSLVQTPAEEVEQKKESVVQEQKEEEVQEAEEVIEKKEEDKETLDEEKEKRGVEKKEIVEEISGDKEEEEAEEDLEEKEDIISDLVGGQEDVRIDWKELPRTEEEKKEEEHESIRQEPLKLERREEKKEEKKAGFFSRLKEKFETTSLNEESFEKLWSNLDEILIENNVAIATIDSIKKKLKEELLGKDVKKSEMEEHIKQSLKNSISSLLIEPFDLIEKIKNSEKPFVIAFFGINGTGKTTTIAKIANMLKENGLSAVLAAGDTFRAASIEQISKHGANLGIDVIKQDYGADSAAVGYDAIAYAKAHNRDVVLIDTAGRMHTEKNLMREMEKICKVTKPHMKIFIGESIVGNDVVEQAKAFNDSISIDGIILTKADVDERGGAAISIGNITGKPVLFLGTGQGYKDIEIFEKEKVLKDMGF
ncbi:MAG: signal recognition particle-docking protein FtsY [archaeon]